MLWRAFKDVKDGFYVDIGAQHPVVDSVSKSFYEAGWRGVHVEPVPEFAELLRSDRPDEDVLQLALGNRKGMLDLFTIPGTGLSTQIEDFAARHLAERNLAATVMAVPVLPASVALKKYAGRLLHWMKLDVEGAERDVLEGWDFHELSPIIILIEATEPNSQRLSHEDWEPLVLQAGYQFAYWDGLNRFYVRSDRSELLDCFSTPPNVFDAAALAGTANAAWHTKIAHDAYEQSQALNAEIGRLRGEQAHQVQSYQSLSTELSSVKSLAFGTAAEYSTALISQRNELDRLINELSLVRQAIRDNEQLFAKHSEAHLSTISGLQFRSAEAESQLQVERSQVASLTAAVAAERDRANGVVDEIDRVTVLAAGEIGALKGQLAEAEATLQQEKTRAVALSVEVDAGRERIASLQADVQRSDERLRAETESLQAQLAEAERAQLERVASLQAEMHMASERLESDIARLRSQLTEAEHARELAQARIASLAQSLDAEGHRLAAVSGEMHRAAENHSLQFADYAAKLDAMSVLQNQLLHQNEKLSGELAQARLSGETELARARAESVELAKWFATTVRGATQATERLAAAQREELNDVKAQASRARLESIHVAERQSVMHREALDDLRNKANLEREAASRQQNSLAVSLAEAQRRAADTDRHLDVVLQSKSWRYTKFIRWLLSIFD